MTPQAPFGDLLRAYRFHRSLTVRDLAPEIGISIATLSRLERGHQPDGDTMLKLLAWMFGRTLR